MSIKSRSIIFKCYYDIYEKRIWYANKQDKMQSKMSYTLFHALISACRASLIYTL